MEMEMRFNAPSTKSSLKLIIDGYKKQFAEVKNKLHELHAPFSSEYEKHNIKAVELDTLESNPESHSLLNLHHEVKDQEDGLVRARQLGHSALGTGQQLKSTLFRQTKDIEGNLGKDDKLRRELKYSDRVMKYIKCADVCDRILLSIIISLLGFLNLALFFYKLTK